MTEGIIGKKLGMTQVFGEDGSNRAVTAIEAGPCTVVQVKSVDKDGYRSVQLGFGEVKKAGPKPKGKAKEKEAVKFRYRRELRLDEGQAAEPGQKIDVSLFKAGDLVDITGTSKGKGFAGGVKRYHFRGGPKTHGQSDRARAPGSVGAGTDPGRVVKGKKMAGHMGTGQVTVKDLKVIRSNPASGILMVQGAVPGNEGALLRVRRSRRGKAK